MANTTNGSFFFDDLGVALGRHGAAKFSAHVPIACRLVEGAVDQFARLAVEQVELDVEPVEQAGEQRRVFGRGRRPIKAFGLPRNERIAELESADGHEL